MRKVLMLFPHEAQPLIEATLQGAEPRERLYGLIELREAGWQVDVADSRLRGFCGWIRRKFGWLVNPIDLRTLGQIAACDVVLVKDDFSLMTAVAGRVLQKRVVFLDSMFDVPKRFWRRWSAVLCTRLAHRVVAFSESQVALWVRTLNVPYDVFRSTSFTLDVPFYRAADRTINGPSYVFAVGRDTGRDFQLVLDAMQGMGSSLELVTLPYLSDRLRPGSVPLHVVPRVSYPELFGLYAGAVTAVVPLRPGITYPSGIRAVLEAMALSTPVIATRTPVLEELFQHEEHLLFAEPDDPRSLRQQLDRIHHDRAFGEAMASRARKEIEHRFGMPGFAEFLQQVLSD